MKIHLRDTNPKVVAAWNQAFHDCSVQISQGDIFDALPTTQAIVSPANSQGHMTGGIDLAYARRWPDLQNRLYRRLLAYPGGLPVGDCITMITEFDEPWILIAPTMPEPMPVPYTANAFLAFSAVLRSARKMEFSSILCPGLCTWSGEMDPFVSAWQMRAAWETFQQDH